ncbi:hypothetical protein GQ53DRAFT_608318, partial [Thozetella sp. PMI_491]
MATDSVDVVKKVYRLRSIPSDVETCASVASLVAESLGLPSASDVVVSSLATTLDYWETPLSKVSTIQFKVVPPFLGHPVSASEWSVPLENGGSLILDTHFLGFTPLNNVAPAQHVLDCITISGLGSHPFGSWQPRGPDKSFLWLRDELPVSAPGTRVIIYGYDSSLIESNSFQSINDIARGLLEQLRASGCHKASAKDLIFLAHSLGGIVLKDTLVQIAGTQNNLDHSLIDKIRGAVMFGVPSLGMEQSFLLSMVEGQANETLVEDLSRDSSYLRNLDKSYQGIAKLRELQIHYAYETRSSPTLGADGIWTRDGPEEILVNRNSATARNITHDPALTFPVDGNHSDIVKFTRGHHDLRVVLSKINLMSSYQHKMGNEMTSPSQSNFIHSLHAPELDSRAAEIEDRFEHTLEWVFELPVFTGWLQHGTGIFWISGKPGSGKSTLMKLISQSQRTWHLLHSFDRESEEISAGFFFHFRGTVMQKSFEGVLRSLLKQILEQFLQRPACHQILSELQLAGFLEKQCTTPSQLEKCLMMVLKQRRCRLDLFLLFDALDEFDGHHNLICSFLTQLVNIPPDSFTTVKVCFSSRPWQIFQKEFGQHPGFRIQDHTQNDIRDYCLGALSDLSEDIPCILELVPNIVHRAAGVFLWVRLVLAQLSDAASTTQDPSLPDLQNIIDSLPTELNDFYDFIIQRIPRSQRWSTYALLELTIRNDDSDERLLPNIILAVVVSGCSRFDEACDNINLFCSQRRDDGLSDKQLIARWSGGLVEVLAGISGDEPSTRQDKFSWIRRNPKARLVARNTIQLMHQTVYEFATSTRFKQRVLGDLGKITHENGHSFHAKWQILEPMCLRDNILKSSSSLLGKYYPNHTYSSFRRHAFKAELTTGRSQKEFLESMPTAAKIALSEGARTPRTESSLELAAYTGLRLYIRDAVAD